MLQQKSPWHSSTPVLLSNFLPPKGVRNLSLRHIRRHDPKVTPHAAMSHFRDRACSLSKSFLMIKPVVRGTDLFFSATVNLLFKKLKLDDALCNVQLNGCLFRENCRGREKRFVISKFYDCSSNICICCNSTGEQGILTGEYNFRLMGLFNLGTPFFINIILYRKQFLTEYWSEIFI